MLALEPEELAAAMVRNMVWISLGLAGFSLADSHNLPRSRESRPSSPIYEACAESLGDYQK
jgi:hypothetical protein